RYRNSVSFQWLIRQRHTASVLLSHLRTRQWKQEMRSPSSSPLLQPCRDYCGRGWRKLQPPRRGPENYAKSGQCPFRIARPSIASNRNSPIRASKVHALILGELSRSLCQKLRISEMVPIDRLAFCIRAAYPTISRCTRAASFCSISLNICSSAMSFSISCTEVPDTCCSSEPILPAASSLALCCGTRGAVALRETTSRISPSSFEKTPAAPLACARSPDRSEFMFNAPD